jgi:hypothetical protein
MTRIKTVVGECTKLAGGNIKKVSGHLPWIFITGTIEYEICLELTKED